MISKTMCDPRNPKTVEFVSKIANSVDRKFRRFEDSCFSMLCEEFENVLASVSKADNPTERLLSFKLRNRGFDYYRKNHTRHAKREVDDSRETVCKTDFKYEFLYLDVLTFKATLSEIESTYWPLLLGQKTGAVLAKELDISPQYVSKQKARLKRKAQAFFREYENDRN